MKIKDAEGTPEEFRNLFRDDGSSLFQYLGVESEVDKRWLWGPIAALAVCVVALVLMSPLAAKSSALLVISGVGAALWLCVLAQRIWKSTAVTIVVAIGCIIILALASGAMTLIAALQHVESLRPKE